MALLAAGCRSRTELTPEQVAAYSRQIVFSNYRLSAAESLVQQTIYHIDAVVKNGTDRPIAVLEAKAVFRDVNRQVVLREFVRIVRAYEAPLAPGQSRKFRMAFENIPVAWNHVAPELEITRLVVE